MTANIKKNETLKNQSERSNGKFLYSREGKYIYFGRWPQTLKEKSVTVTQGVPENSPVENNKWYYTGSDGEIYMEANEYVGAVKNAFFKVEPIKWRILEEKDGVALLLSEDIIDAEFFGGDNCYAGSMLSNWLNRHVYGVAFTDDERALILPTLLDNSAASTAFEENPDACYDDEEYVFLLSYKEAFKSYGLTDGDRKKKYTDFTFSRSGSGFCGEWVLRSPYPDKWHWTVSAVDENGKETTADLQEWYYGGSSGSDGACTGIAPAIRIKLTEK